METQRVLRRSRPPLPTLSATSPRGSFKTKQTLADWISPDLLTTESRMPLDIVKSSIFMIGVNRAGTTLLLESLGRSTNLWTYQWNGVFWEGVFPWYGFCEPPDGRHFSRELPAPGRLFGYDAAPEIKKFACEAMLLHGKNHIGTSYLANPGADSGKPLRFLHKTPINCLQISFLNALFPDALFIYIIRDGFPTVSSMIEHWNSDEGGYPLPPSFRLCDDESGMWALIPVPGWENRGRSMHHRLRFRERLCFAGPREYWRPAPRVCGSLRRLRRRPSADN